MRAPGSPSILLAIACVNVCALACKGGTVEAANPGGPGGTGTTIASSGGGSGGSILSVPASIASTPTTPHDAAISECTDGGDCVCPTLSVAVVGKPGVWGDSSDTAFQNWLNSSSAGTAKVDNYLDKPAFTAEFLAKYNVIILASLGDHSANGPWWTFSASETTAFQDWIENQGGGVIALSGYSSDSKEIDAKNALLAFSGIAYQQQNISPPCLIEDAQKNKLCYRCGNPYQIAEWNRTDPVVANLSRNVTMIGMDGGHPIDAPADAHVAAMTTTATTVNNWLVGKIVGKGHVLFFADEWIAYTNQWAGQSTQNDPSCKDYLPQDVYQTSQLWFNMIRWTQPTGNCFTIVDNTHPVKIW